MTQSCRIIKRDDISSGRHILVTSDIHGHLTRLEKVLEMAAFSNEDILVIVGDVIEKGLRNLDTLRYVMKLCENGNAVFLSGNVDVWRVAMLDSLDADSAGDLYGYIVKMRNWKGTSFVDEMTSELGFTAKSPQELLGCKEKLLSSFAEELNFIRCAPTILETRNYIFVHGGLPDKNPASLAGRNVFDVLKYDNFMESAPHFDKYVVVGH